MATQAEKDQKRQEKQELTRFEGQLTQLLPKIAELLPQRAGDPHRFMRMVLMAAVRNPGLLRQDRRESLLLAVMNCAELGLSCTGGPASRAHLVCYGSKVECIPDYKGFIDIALDSGFYSAIEAETVCEHDSFVYRRGTDPRLDHTPLLVGDRGDIIATYAIAWPKDSPRPTWIVMAVAEVNSIRDESPGYQYQKKKGGTDNPWITHYPEMVKKTGVRRLYKWLKSSRDMERAVDLDSGDAIPAVDLSDIIDIQPPTPEEIAERGKLLGVLAAARLRDAEAVDLQLEANGYPRNTNPETLHVEVLRTLAQYLQTPTAPAVAATPDAQPELVGVGKKGGK
jgi:recombination protein RecT